MRADAGLLSCIIEYWDAYTEVFMVRGEEIQPTLPDIYFMTGLPMYGVVGDTQLVLPRGRTLHELVEKHRTQGSRVHDGAIQITYIERL